MSAQAHADSWEHSRSTTPASGRYTATVIAECDDESLNALAEEQIRGLLAQVFLGAAERVSKHVLLGAVDRETDTWGLCTQLGLGLARETIGTVLVARGDSRFIVADSRPSAIRESCLRLAPNLWMLADPGTDGGSRQSAPAYQADSFLQQVRREFDYSILHVQTPRLLSEASRMGNASDGLILVVGAHGTRRAAAQQMRQALTTAGVHLIGAVLTGRTFPVPEGVYRRL